MPTINFIEYANYLNKLGFCDEIKNMEDLSVVLHSDFLRTKLNNYLSSIQMMEADNDNRIQIIGYDENEVHSLAYEIFDGLVLDEIEKDENSYVYNHYDSEESFEFYIHAVLDYVLDSEENLVFGLTFESLDSGVVSMITINKDNISIKNYIQANILSELSPFEQYIYSMTVAAANLYNTDLFNELTEVDVDEDYYKRLENDLFSQENHYTIEQALKDYPNLFTDKNDFISALNINPKLFLDAPVEVLENPEFLNIFLHITESYEQSIIQGIDYIAVHNEDGIPDPFADVIIKDVIHKNMRAVPSVHEMAIAYKDSLKFLRKKSTHAILIGSYLYNRMICLTKNQFEDRVYVTSLQRQIPFFYANIFFYYAFYELKNRKYTAVEQIEKDTYKYMNDAYDLNLFDYFEDSALYDEEFMDNLNFAFRDTIVSIGINETQEFDFEEDFKIDDQIKKYYS